MIKQIQGNTLKFDGWNKLKENEIVFFNFTNYFK
jgi:hypothetical protein